MAGTERLCELSAVTLRRLIGRKAVSPVELLEDCLERIAAVNPVLNAVTAMCTERAREEARAAEQAVIRGDDLGLTLPPGLTSSPSPRSAASRPHRL